MPDQAEQERRDAADGTEVIASRGQKGMDFAEAASEPLVPDEALPAGDSMQAAPSAVLDSQAPAQNDMAVNEAPVDYDG